MASDNMMLYTALYDDLNTAMEDLHALEELHEEQVLGKYDAAVIDKKEGKPHIVKRMDRPRVRIIPEVFGGGTLHSKELKAAADELTGGEAGLIVAGEPTLEQAFDKAVTKAAKVVKRSFDATTDEIAKELQELAESEPKSEPAKASS